MLKFIKESALDLVDVFAALVYSFFITAMVIAVCWWLGFVIFALVP